MEKCGGCEEKCKKITKKRRFGDIFELDKLNNFKEDIYKDHCCQLNNKKLVNAIKRRGEKNYSTLYK